MGRGERQRRHTPQFKLEAVRLLRERQAAGVSVARVAEELDLNTDLLRLWARHVEEAPEHASAEEVFPGSGHRRPRPRVRGPKVDQPLTLEQEVVRLRRENERLRMERDFLKKAAAFFAKESR